MQEPIGIVKMYRGTGIANVNDRSVEIGAEVGDTIALPGWYVCNGNEDAGVIDLRNYFIRSEIISDHIDGHDDAYLKDHTHFGGDNMWRKDEVSPSRYVDSPNVNADSLVESGVFDGDGVDGNMPLYYSLIFLIKMEEREIFYCTSEADISKALTDIDDNAGTIILTSGIISLEEPISINGGGSYIIQGQGNGSVIDSGDNTTFSITSATSCVLRNFKIDASDLSSANTNIIDINEEYDNDVTIDNVLIQGDTGKRGIGICISSHNCIVRNCKITQVSTGIRVNDGNNNVISGNILIDNGVNGLWVEGEYNIISSNIANVNDRYGIFLDNSQYGSITGNICNNNDSDYASDTAGIYVDNSSANNSIVGNLCCNNENVGAGDGFGILIFDDGNTLNLVMANIALINDTMTGWDSGTNTFYETADNEPLNLFQ